MLNTIFPPPKVLAFIYFADSLSKHFRVIYYQIYAVDILDEVSVELKVCGFFLTLSKRQTLSILESLAISSLSSETSRI